LNYESNVGEFNSREVVNYYKNASVFSTKEEVDRVASETRNFE